jgi:enoyl-[acyl-carrier protein] reductase III
LRVRVLVGPILTADPDAFAEAITLNGTSLVFLTQAVRPLLRRGSSIVKALAEALVRYLVPELAPLGVRINCIAPGTLDTEAVRNLFGKGTEAFLSQEAAGNPSGRNIAHDDYVGLVEFLAGPEAQMIHGQVIFINGGQYIIACSTRQGGTETAGGARPFTPIAMASVSRRCGKIAATGAPVFRHR